MESYITFIFGDFDDFDSIEFFCNEILLQSPSITDLNYIIHNFNNIIVIFSSDKNKHELIQEINTLFEVAQVEYFVMFKLENIFSYSMPDKITEILFKPKKNHDEKNEVVEDFDIDVILEKISKHGIDSISKEEKKFLDNFKF